MTDVAFYNSARARAAKDIRNKGRKVFYRRLTLSEEDAITGHSDPFGPVLELDALEVNIDHSEIANTDLSTTRKQLLMVLDFEPQKQDTITFDGVVYSVLSWKVVAPGGIPVLHKIMIA